MTRFVSQAVGMRARSYKAFDTAAQERRDRRVAQAAGCSPQQLQQHRRRQKQLADLPPPPARGTNPRPFLELAVAGRPVGRLVVELFAQEAGAAAAAFLQRCQAGAASGLSFKGAKVGRVVEGYSVQLDLPRGQPVPGLGNPELQHGTRHTVSLSQEGTEVLVTCGAEPARELDEAGYLVVGRVVEGAEAGGVLHTIEQAPVGADDEPLQAISVSACGLNAQTGPLAGAAGRSRGRPQNLLSLPLVGLRLLPLLGGAATRGLTRRLQRLGQSRRRRPGRSCSGRAKRSGARWRRRWGPRSGRTSGGGRRPGATSPPRRRLPGTHWAPSAAPPPPPRPPTTTTETFLRFFQVYSDFTHNGGPQCTLHRPSGPVSQSCLGPARGRGFLPEPVLVCYWAE